MSKLKEYFGKVKQMIENHSALVASILIALVLLVLLK
jgi:hypothetical protein